MGTADPAMQNAVGVLVETQRHGYVLGLQHEIGGSSSKIGIGSGGPGLDFSSSVTRDAVCSPLAGQACY